MFSIILESLRNGNIRATGRIDGRTITFIDGSVGQESAIVSKVMRETAGSQRVSGNNYDMTYIQMNDAAKKAFEATK